MLVDSERIVNAAEAAYFTRLGVPMDGETARARFKGNTVPDVGAAVAQAAPEPLPPDWMYGWAMTTALALVRDLEPVDGVERVVAAVVSAGLPTCVASQSPLPRVALSLTVSKLDRFFGDHVYTASMVARPKPYPDLYRYAAERLDVTPAAAAVVEDSPSGVRAARAAGMTVFGYAADEDAGELEAAGAIVFTSMRELPALLGLDLPPRRV